MVRYVLSLPLNLIPVVGTVFFLGLAVQVTAAEQALTLAIGTMVNHPSRMFGGIKTDDLTHRFEGRTGLSRAIFPIEGL